MGLSCWSVRLVCETTIHISSQPVIIMIVWIIFFFFCDIQNLRTSDFTACFRVFITCDGFIICIAAIHCFCWDEFIYAVQLLGLISLENCLRLRDQRWILSKCCSCCSSRCIAIWRLWFDNSWETINRLVRTLLVFQIHACFLITQSSDVIIIATDNVFIRLANHLINIADATDTIISCIILALLLAHLFPLIHICIFPR